MRRPRGETGTRALAFPTSLLQTLTHIEPPDFIL